MLARLTSHRVLSLVLIWALLLCHGAFGALHQFGGRDLQHPSNHQPAPAFTDSALADHTLAGHDVGHPAGGHGIAGDEPAGSTSYAAVLVILFLLAGYLLHRGIGGPLVPVSFALTDLHPPAFLPRRVRGPTLLQVFRL